MIFRERASVVCVWKGQLLAVILEDPATGVREHYLPGGALEANESPVAAGARETLEETGYEVEVLEGSQRSLRYPFTWGGQTYDCLTHFFAAHLKDPTIEPAIVVDATYHKGVTWVPVAEIEKAFGFQQELLQQILALLPLSEGHATRRFRTFQEFWPFYVREHSSLTNRRLHAIGTSLAIAIGTLALQQPRFWILVPVVGYGFAWFGHYFVQRNRPATFQYPLWSFLADFKMLGLTATGRMDQVVARALADT